MLTLSTKRLAYSAVLAGLLVLVAVGGLGIARGIAHSQSASGDDSSVSLLRDAQGLMEEAASLDFTEHFEPEDFMVVFDLLGEAAQMHEAGEVEEAVALVRRTDLHVQDMTKMARENGNEGIFETLSKTHELLTQYIS